MSKSIKIMVVDDTITYRQIVGKVVESIDGAELFSSASSGRTALMKLESARPDLIFLDVMMPEMDGIETLSHIKEKYPDLPVVMVSGVDLENAKTTLASLEAGALDFVAKPQTQGMAESMSQLKTALEPVIRLVRDRLYPEEKNAPVAKVIRSVPTAESKELDKPFNMILLGISTGGPSALFSLFSILKGKLPCPLLIVQHMPPMFTQSLAERLNGISEMEVTEAVDGEPALAGRVYIAPGGKHLVVVPGGSGYTLKVTDTPPVNHCKPAVDVLFDSVAGISSAHPLSVVMTGMGKDGTSGVRSLKQAGTYTLVQDQESSVVWGMPGSVYEAKLADEILPIEGLAKRITELSHKNL